jgi:hypothetical protein
MDEVDEATMFVVSPAPFALYSSKRRPALRAQQKGNVALGSRSRLDPGRTLRFSELGEITRRTGMGGRGHSSKKSCATLIDRICLITFFLAVLFQPGESLTQRDRVFCAQ